MVIEEVTNCGKKINVTKSLTLRRSQIVEEKLMSQNL
jgi:hypothetical protein